MKKKTVYLILLVFWMGVIFFMSAQPSVESEETSSYVAEIVYVLYDLFLSGTVHLSRTDFIEMYLQPIRKLAHFRNCHPWDPALHQYQRVYGQKEFHLCSERRCFICNER